MESSLKIADLHEAYRTASPADAIAMANLGAICWTAAKSELFSHWETAMSAEETAKADTWRKEGAATMLESVKMRLAQADTLSIRLATAEATVTQLQVDMEAEAAKRADALVAAARQGFELAKAHELMDIKSRLAAAEAKEEMLSMLREGQAAMRDRIAVLQGEVTQYQEAVATKSSHAIGKAGEATIWEMIESNVLTEFEYSDARNMSGVSHAADFHLWVVGPTGKRIKILIDSKKYKRAVNSDEINKLCADVDADDDAHAGMLISLVSPIFTKKQFEIRNSLKQKPILYMSFCDVGEEFHSQLLCNGIRALIAVVSEMKEENRSDIIQQFDEVVAEVTKAAKDIDNVIKAQVKTIDSLRQIKASLLDKIAVQPTVHQTVKLDEDGGNIIEHTGACIVTIKVTGKPCGKPVWAGGVKCKLHTTRKVREAISGAGAGGSAGEPAGDLSAAP